MPLQTKKNLFSISIINKTCFYHIAIITDHYLSVLLIEFLYYWLVSSNVQRMYYGFFFEIYNVYYSDEKELTISKYHNVIR
jgi:hypothetical protein